MFANLMVMTSELLICFWSIYSAGHKTLQTLKLLWRSISVCAQACFLLHICSYFQIVCFLTSFLVPTELARKIMRGIALALGGSPDEFEGDRAGNAFWVTRLIGYPGVSTANGTVDLKNDVGW